MALSWFGLGVWYGWGYLPLHGLALANPVANGLRCPALVHAVVDLRLTGVVVEPGVADRLALVTLTASTRFGVMLRVRDRGRSNR